MSTAPPRTQQAVQQAFALMQSQRASEARDLLQQALRRAPNDPALNSAMATAWMILGQFVQAEFFARKALSAAPTNPDLLVTLANIQVQWSKPAEACETFTRALSASPEHLPSRLGRASALRLLRRFTEAAADARLALSLAPRDPDATVALADALQNLGRTDEAAEALEEAAREHPTSEALMSFRAFALNYLSADPARVFEAHRAAGALIQARVAPMAPPPAPAPTPARAPIRVGLVTPDLRRHSVAYFAEPLLRHHDRAALDLTIYHTHASEDDVTSRLKPLVSRWRSCFGKSNREIAAQVRADGIDVLIEMSGYTRGNRLPLMALRAARAQATWLGYPATTGLTCVDARLTDALADPPGAESLHTERPLRLPRCAWCYAPPEDSPEPATPATHEPITFISAAALPKLSRETLTLWRDTLSATPSSRLILKNRAFADASARDDLAQRLAALGLSPERVSLEPGQDAPREHLAALGRAHVALDTFPYAGTTSTCEALWMGVPVVSLVGASHVSRVGLSLLSAVGLGDLAVTSREEFVRVASGLAQDRARLSSLRASLRATLLASPLGDGPAYARDFEAAVRALAEGRA
ncbi:MAG: tetratricopeptide repeat protein [Planctomycetota bacterium]|nr:tetratricopeptide repeat protein [Planctomycetota bacterium]